MKSNSRSKVRKYFITQDTSITNLLKDYPGIIDNTFFFYKTYISDKPEFEAYKTLTKEKQSQLLHFFPPKIYKNYRRYEFQRWSSKHDRVNEIERWYTEEEFFSFTAIKKAFPHEIES